MEVKTKLMAIVATAAAVAFVTAPITSTVAQAHSKVKCFGVNKCKGKGSCKTAKNQCKGTNSCKGQGITMVRSEKKCERGHGTVVKD